jgi:hypothetical protein
MNILVTTKTHRHHHIQSVHHHASASPRPQPADSNETLQRDNKDTTCICKDNNEAKKDKERPLWKMKVCYRRKRRRIDKSRSEVGRQRRSSTRVEIWNIAHTNPLPAGPQSAVSHVRDYRSVYAARYKLQTCYAERTIDGKLVLLSMGVPG